ncbi:MAG: CehA/McbA family metallohydrolase [Pseudomonadota bacterium]
MFEAFEGPGQFLRGNLHGHSTGSDGALTPEEVCSRYREAGYDFVVLSDHFFERYGFPITKTEAFRQRGFTTLLGAELHTRETSRGELWHIVAAGLPADFAPTAADESGPDLARRAAEAGAFVAIAHPLWSQLTEADGLAIDHAHAVEIYNHKSALETDRGDGLYLWDALLHAGRRVTAVACDDSHWKNRDAFGGWVMVRAEPEDPASILEALRRGAFYSSQGPAIFEATREGDDILVRCSAATSVILAGPMSWRQRVLGSDIETAKLPIEPEAGGWRRLIVRDANGRRAWSNPFWIDA